MKERVIQLAQTVKDIQAKPKSGTDFRTGNSSDTPMVSIFLVNLFITRLLWAFYNCT